MLSIEAIAPLARCPSNDGALIVSKARSRSADSIGPLGRVAEPGYQNARTRNRPVRHEIDLDRSPVHPTRLSTEPSSVTTAEPEGANRP